MRRLVLVIVAAAAGVAVYRQRRLDRSELELALAGGDEPGSAPPPAPPVIRA